MIYGRLCLTVPCREISARQPLKIRYGFQALFPFIQPLREVLFCHYGNAGAVCFTDLRCVIGIHQKSSIVYHNESGQHIQKLFELQIVVIPHPAVMEFLAVNMRKAHDALPKLWQPIVVRILAQCEIQRVDQKFCALPLLSLGQQARQRDLQHILLRLNADTLHHTGRSEIGFLPCGR